MCVCMKIETLMIPDEGRRVMGPGVELPGPRAVSGRRSGERRVRFDCKFEFRASAMEVMGRRMAERKRVMEETFEAWKRERTNANHRAMRLAIRRCVLTQEVELQLIGGAL